MAHVDQAEVVKFMKTHAARAPESQEMREGQYDHMLVKSALDLTKNIKHNSTEWCAAYEWNIFTVVNIALPFKKFVFYFHTKKLNT